MRRKLDLLILLLVLIIGALGLTHARAIGDWWHARTYSPPTEIVQLADDAGMSETGRQLFYRFEPTLADQATLDDKCNAEKLGCTEGRFIFILKPANQAEHNRAVVTAAHEMLHIVYSRLSTQTQNDVDALLKTELDKPAATDILDELNGYAKEDYYNEAHSFVGSELPDLSTELETHYSQYFSDRTKTVAAYASSPER